jgi:hypothetical protein
MSEPEVNLTYDNVGGSYPWEVYQRVTTEKKAARITNLANAAPALLEACKAFLFEMSGERFDADDELGRLRLIDAEFRRLRKLARAAIAAAEPTEGK